MRALIVAAVAMATAAPLGAQGARDMTAARDVTAARYVPRDPPATIDTAYSVTVSRAKSALAARQWACAAALWRSALESNARVAEHWRDYGRALYHDAQYREAVAALQRAVQLGGLSGAEGAWEVARAYARLGNTVQAYRWLARARDAGYQSRDAVRNEPAFAGYLDDPRFESLAEGIERGARGGPMSTVVSTAI